MPLKTNLLTLRAENNYTQEKVASLLNFPLTTYRNYENDITTLKYDTLKIFSDFYNVSYDYLLKITDNKKRHPKSSTKGINRLKFLRQINKISQQQLASELGLSRGSIVCYENGNREIPSDLLVIISNKFNVNVEYILFLTDNKEIY